MRRLVSTGVAVVAVAVAVAAFAAAALGAPTGAICPSFKQAGATYRWSVIGNVTCKEAKPWLVKLLAVHGKPGTKVVFKHLPKGFKCSAAADSRGVPGAGGCYTGTVAFPKNGFQWLG